MTATNLQATEHLETLISDIWTRVLGLENAARDQDFFNLGGNSIQALDLAGQLSEKLPFEAPLVALFFENPTIGGFARAVVAEAAAEDLQRLVS